MRLAPLASATPFVLALAVLAPCREARADDTADIQALLSENVITTASTTAEKASSAPATSVTITAEQLQVFGIRTLAEAVDFLSVGLVTSDPLRTPDMGTRGVLIPNDGGKHYLLLINGHAVNDPLYGAARFDAGAGVPIDVIDHIEVVVGPGSVLYGSNAMLGVINVVTKTGGQYDGLHVLGELEPGRTGRVGIGGGTTFRWLGQKADLTATAEYFGRFGPDLDFGIQRNPATPAFGLERYRRGGPADGVWGGTLKDAYFVQAPSGLVRLRLGDLELQLGASAYRRGIPYTMDGTSVDFDDPESYELDRALRFDAKHEAVLSSLVQLTSRVYADHFDYQRQVNREARSGCFRNTFQTCTVYDAGLSRWAGIEERVALNWFEDLSFVTTIGIDARMRAVQAKQDATIFPTGRPFAATSGIIDDGGALISPYLQQTWSPVRWVDVNGGIRLDADSRFDPQLSPRGAVAFHPFEGNTVKAIYSQAFRAPAWMETDANNLRLTPTTVRPETVRSIEASVEQRLGTQRVLVGAFRTHWDDLVELTPLTNADVARLQSLGLVSFDVYELSQYRNVSSIENFGWNAKWEGTANDGRLSYGGSVTEAFTRRQASAGLRPLAVSPQLFGNVHVAYDFGGAIPVPGIAAHYVGERLVDRYFVDPRYQVMPSPSAFVDLRVTLSGRIPGAPGLGYRLSAAYATNETGAYVAGPGILNADPARTSFPRTPVDRFRFFVGLRYDFSGAAKLGAAGEEP